MKASPLVAVGLGYWVHRKSYRWRERPFAPGKIAEPFARNNVSVGELLSVSADTAHLRNLFAHIGLDVVVLDSALRANNELAFKVARVTSKLNSRF